ncbi:hypothetical protein MTO96_024104 [Rhipicephalus appendiculatus]
MRIRRQSDPSMRIKETDPRRHRRADLKVQCSRPQELPPVRRRDPKEVLAGATGRFKRECLNHEFGTPCDVRDRLWFDSQASSMSGIRSDDQCVKTFDVIREYIPSGSRRSSWGSSVRHVQGHLGVRKDTYLQHRERLRAPSNARSLPRLNALDERPVAPRLPFNCTRRLYYSRGHYGIMGRKVGRWL